MITYQLKYGESALEETNGYDIESPNHSKMLSQKVFELEKDKAELHEKLECIQNSDTEFLEEEMLILVKIYWLILRPVFIKTITLNIFDIT